MTAQNVLMEKENISSVDKYNLEKLERIQNKNSEIKKGIVKDLGFIPESVWKIDFAKSKNMPEFIKTQQQNAKDFLSTIDDLELRKKCSEIGFSLPFKNIRSKDGTGGISVFPFDLAEKAVKFYTNRYDVVFDPCAGHCTRNHVCYLNDRHYFAYDISRKFVDENNRIIKENFNNSLIKKKLVLKIYNKDSRTLHFLNSCFDFVFTSPPYYNLEYYGNEDEQLGRAKSYNNFLFELKKVISECYRVLKYNKFIVFNVNDFTDKGVFHNYHSDVANIFKEVGFKLHDIIIVDWGISIAVGFVNEIFRTKKTGKRHEYLIVGKKITDKNMEYSREKLLNFEFENNIIDENEVNELIEKNNGMLSRAGALRILEREKTQTLNT